MTDDKAIRRSAVQQPFATPEPESAHAACSPAFWNGVAWQCPDCGVALQRTREPYQGPVRGKPPRRTVPTIRIPGAGPGAGPAVMAGPERSETPDPTADAVARELVFQREQVRRLGDQLRAALEEARAAVQDRDKARDEGAQLRAELDVMRSQLDQLHASAGPPDTPAIPIPSSAVEDQE